MDIKTVFDAKKMIDETSCDAVMIGRGALGNPWIICDVVKYLQTGIVLQSPTYDDRISMIKKHLKYLMKNKSEEVSIKEMRLHVSYYLKGMPKSSEVKSKIFKTVKQSEFIKILDDYLQTLN